MASVEGHFPIVWLCEVTMIMNNDKRTVGTHNPRSHLYIHALTEKQNIRKGCGSCVMLQVATMMSYIKQGKMHIDRNEHSVVPAMNLRLYYPRSAFLLNFESQGKYKLLVWLLA